MDNWILKNAGSLVNEPVKEQTVGADEVKVKIAYVLANNFDAVLYSGETKVRYPKTIGRFAVGRVTEAGAECYGVEKNMRVLLQPTRSCGSCLECKTEKEDECASPWIAGRDFDGFLRDFAVCKYTDVAPLPDSVTDTEALCTEAVAIAENINEATSGQLCDAAVYTTCSRLDPATTMRVLANGKSAVLAGFAPINFNIPARELCDKNTTLFSVMNGFGYTDTAINLLVHKAVNTDVFEKEMLTDFDPNAIYKGLCDVNNARKSKMTIFKLII